MPKTNCFYIKSYFDFNFLDYNTADKFAEDIKNKIESNEKWKYDKLYVVVLGAGLGNYLVPIIFNLSNKLNFNIELFHFDKDDIFLNMTKFYMKKFLKLGAIFGKRKM